MTDVSGLTEAQRRRAARRLRRVLGRAEFDALFGAPGREAAVTALLGHQPVVTTRSVQDGLDLLEDKHRAHPDGLRAERVGARLSWLRNLMMAVFGVVVVAVVVVMVWVTVDAEDEAAAFAVIEDDLGPVLGIGLLVPFALSILLLWVTTSWRHVIAVADARFAVRWARDRPGQLERGLPVVEPVSGFRFWPLAGAVVSWGVGGLLGLVVLTMLGQDDTLRVPILITLGFLLLGTLLFGAFRALRQTGAVATEHLCLLRHRRHGLRVDAATAVQEQFLVLTPGTFGTVSVREWTAYPFTVQLSAEQLRRRHEQARQEIDSELTVVGTADEAPLVTSEKPGEDDGADGRFGGEYAGGWLVARATQKATRRPAWVIVRSDPERFAEQVLPHFGDRHDLEPRSIVVLERPERVPSEHGWVREWVKERS